MILRMEINSLGKVYQVYIDATIPSNLVARLSQDPKIAEWQRITREFWQDARFEFILSDIVIDEISAGDEDRAADRLQAVEDCTIVVAAALEFEVAGHLIAQNAIPQSAFIDALHVAVAATHNIPYLATWNFAHLANTYTRPKIDQVCRDAGYSPPHVDSPKSIMEGL